LFQTKTLRLEVAADDSDREASMTAPSASFGTAQLVGGVARFLSSVLPIVRHPVESIREGADLVLRLHDAAVLELSGGERLGSFQSWRRGLTIRPDSVHAIADVSSSVASANRRAPGQTPEHGRECDIGRRPTDTSQGTSFAVDEPVMRLDPSGHTVNSPASLAARCRATSALLLRSRLISCCRYCARRRCLAH